MQLKRDTEYALRIMICIAEDIKNNGGQEGIRCTKVLAETGIPLVGFYRICRQLEENGLVRNEIKANGEKWMYPGDGFWDQSILSIGEAMEGTMKLFAVFDKNSYLSQQYGKKLNETQTSLNKILIKTTMKELVFDC